MKKILAIFACLSVFCTVIFAEAIDTTDFDTVTKFEKEKLIEETIIPEDQHCADKNAKVWIVYRPAYHEAYIYYETMYVTYEEGEAMNTVIAVLEDFCKDKKYKHYNYLEADKTKYRKSDRGNKATYSSHVKFAY